MDGRKGSTKTSAGVKSSSRGVGKKQELGEKALREAAQREAAKRRRKNHTENLERIVHELKTGKKIAGLRPEGKSGGGGSLRPVSTVSTSK
jgi:hypothetical protein